MNERYNINSKWFAGIDRNDKEAVQRRVDLVLGSAAIFDVMREVIEADQKSLDLPSTDDYNCPSWAYKEADRKGQLRKLRDFLALIQRTPVNG